MKKIVLCGVIGVCCVGSVFACSGRVGEALPNGSSLDGLGALTNGALCAESSRNTEASLHDSSKHHLTPLQKVGVGLSVVSLMLGIGLAFLSSPVGWTLFAVFTLLGVGGISGSLMSSKKNQASSRAAVPEAKLTIPDGGIKSAWFDAVHKNDTARLNKLMKSYEICGERDEGGYTALMYAAQEGNVEYVKLLVGREGGLQNEDGRTALMYAACNGHVECVKVLLEREGGLQNAYGDTALMQAARSGHPEIVKLLLEKEGGMQDDNGRTALMIAAVSGPQEVVDILLDQRKVCEASIEKLKTSSDWPPYQNLLNQIYEKHPDLKKTDATS